MTFLANEEEKAWEPLGASGPQVLLVPRRARCKWIHTQREPWYMSHLPCLEKAFVLSELDEQDCHTFFSLHLILILSSLPPISLKCP